MHIYTILFFLIFILYFGFQKKCNVYIFISLGLIFLLFSLRNFSVGIDVKNYMIIYEEQTIPNIKYLKSIFPNVDILVSDYLYFIYSWILLCLGVSKRGFLIITAICMLVPEYIFIKRYSKHPLISVMTFITIGQMIMMMSAFRQGMAVALSIFALNYLIKKQPFKYFLIVFIAAGFHMSAYILIPAYFIVAFFKNKKPEITLTVFTLAGVLGGSFLIILLSSLNLGVRFNIYLGGGIAGTNPLVMIMYLLIAIIYVISRKNNIKYLKKEKIDEKIIFIWFCIGLGIIALSLQNTIISRFSYYFLSGVPIILDRVIDMQNNLKTRGITILSCLLIEIIYFYYTVPTSDFGVANYSFYWI